MDITNIFKNKKYNKTKLINYGFSAEADNYVLRTYINNKDFLLEIIINKDGAVTSKVTDIDVQEEYTLHLAEIANGNFINKIKQVYNNVIHDILINCFDRDECVFTESISKKLWKAALTPKSCLNITCGR